MLSACCQSGAGGPHVDADVQYPWFAPRGGCCLDADHWDLDGQRRVIARLPPRDRYVVACRDARDVAVLAASFGCTTLAEPLSSP
jgi:hypothetical protein